MRMGENSVKKKHSQLARVLKICKKYRIYDLFINTLKCLSFVNTATLYMTSYKGVKKFMILIFALFSVCTYCLLSMDI